MPGLPNAASPWLNCLTRLPDDNQHKISNLPMFHHTMQNPQTLLSVATLQSQSAAFPNSAAAAIFAQHFQQVKSF